VPWQEGRDHWWRDLLAGRPDEAPTEVTAANDPFMIIYTSGTTGPPKGVQLTHRNQLAQCRGLQGAMPWRDEGGAAVSFLPSAHIADRGMLHLGQMIWGFAITPCPDPSRVFEYVADVRPTWFGSVPRMWEKLKASLEASGAALEKMGELTPVAFWWVLKVETASFQLVLHPCFGVSIGSLQASFHTHHCHKHARFCLPTLRALRRLSLVQC